MSSDRRLPVVLCWHMHQPEYRDLVSGEVQLPWVMLRSLKDYVDMAAHLEAAPWARVVVNFSPVLLDQIQACARQLDELVRSHCGPGEPLLRALVELPSLRSRTRADLVGACLRPVAPRMAARSPALAAAERVCARAVERGQAAELDDDNVRTLLVRYLLCWLGESLRTDARAVALEAHAGSFSEEQCRQMLHLIRDAITGLLPRYSKLGRSGQIELSMSPYFHPITPLLIDFAAARDAVPDVAIPSSAYPGGVERARWQLEAGRDRFEQVLGVRPRGCWPSEAAVSDTTLELIAQTGFAWTASSQGVLEASARARGRGPDDPYRRYGFAQTPLSCFFRDDQLSDRVGFVYQSWGADEAVADFIGRLERVPTGPGRCACVILDGENPWDGYEHNGAAFLRGIYQQVAFHSRLRLATFTECIEEAPAVPQPLPRLIAGSWVQGQLLTWIGNPAKNLLWERLIRAKRQFDEAVRDAEVHRLLGACEGSDWFWWADGSKGSQAASDFEHLLALHLLNLERASQPASTVQKLAV